MSERPIVPSPERIEKERIAREERRERVQNATHKRVESRDSWLEKNVIDNSKAPTPKGRIN